MCISWIDTKIKRTIVFCSEPSGSADIFTGRSWIYRPTANGIFNLPAIIRPFYSRPLFSTFPPSHEGWGWRYDGHSFSMDPLRRTGEIPCSKRRKKRKKKILAKFLRCHPRLRIYGKSLKFFADITQSARTDMRGGKGGKSLFEIDRMIGWDEDEGDNWSWRCLRERIVMVVFIDSLIPGFVKVS